MAEPRASLSLRETAGVRGKRARLFRLAFSHRFATSVDLIQPLVWIINLRASPARYPVKSLKHWHIASCRGCVILAVFSAVFLAASFTGPGLRGTIFDFSAQYQGVSASAGSGSVTMSVFDEERLSTSTLNVESGVTFDLSAINGVVVWSSGNIVYYYTYDAISGSWKGESVNPAPPANNLRTTNGIVTWSTTAGTVYYRVFDRARCRRPDSKRFPRWCSR